MVLRCPHRKFGELTHPSADAGLLEVSCPSRWCGKAPGTVVLHTFNTHTGELVATRAYREPPRKG